MVEWRTLRLFCLPHAGAGASVFARWSRALAPGIEVRALQLPGRETRLREPPPSAMTPLVRELADTIGPALDRPFAIFGHSMGALIGFELARELRRRARPAPQRILMSGLRAPDRPSRLPPLAAMPDPAFLDAVQDRYGRFAEEVLREPELLDLIRPVLRADLRMIEAYQFVEELPLDCALSVFGGVDDHTVTPDELDGWRRHTRVSFDLKMVPGGHFFPQESRDQLIAAVARRLA